MKNAATTILAAALPLLARAVASPLPTWGDYVFTKPALTNAIKGIVMGDAGGYGAMRYEDLAFIDEALAERQFLFTGATNNPPSIASLPITKWTLTVGFVPLSPSNALSTAARLVEPASNIVEWSEYKLGDNWDEDPEMTAFTNYTYVVNVLTNGTTEVFTNSCYVSSNYIHHAAATNAATIADLCMADFVYPFSEDVRVSYNLFDGNAMSYRTGPFYSRATMTNLYAFVRAMRRSQPKIPQTYCRTADTNMVEDCIFRHYTQTTVNTETGAVTRITTDNVYTNTYHGSIWPPDFIYDVVISGYKSGEGGSNSDGSYDWSVTIDEYDCDFRDYARGGRLFFSSGLPLALESQGAMERISRVHAFGQFTMSYRHYTDMDWSTADGGEDSSSAVVATNECAFVCPLGEAVRVADETACAEATNTACFSLPMNDVVSRALAAAWGFAGDKYIILEYDDPLPEIEIPPYEEYEESGGSRRYDWYSFVYTSFDISLVRLWLVYEFAPKATLQSWEEYD